MADERPGTVQHPYEWAFRELLVVQGGLAAPLAETDLEGANGMTAHLPAVRIDELRKYLESLQQAGEMTSEQVPEGNSGSPGRK